MSISCASAKDWIDGEFDRWINKIGDESRHAWQVISNMLEYTWTFNVTHSYKSTRYSKILAKMSHGSCAWVTWHKVAYEWGLHTSNCSWTAKVWFLASWADNSRADFWERLPWPRSHPASTGWTCLVNMLRSQRCHTVQPTAAHCNTLDADMDADMIHLWIYWSIPIGVNGVNSPRKDSRKSLYTMVERKASPDADIIKK